ncbi:MAG: Protease HtpX homolog, partial [uncultured Solirubrobacteraceae bacterium]
GSIYLLRQGHRTASSDVDHDVVAGPRLRRPHGRARLFGLAHRARRHRRRCALRPAVLLLRSPRPARHGRPGGLPAGGSRAPRDDRAPLHPGGHPEAEGRRGLHAHAERVRPRAFAPACDGLRDHRDHGTAVPRRARRGHGPRAHPHRQPRRRDHDPGELLRLAGLDDHPVRLLLRRWPLRRRRLAGHPAADPRQRRGLRGLVLSHAGAVALPRVRGRPRRGDHHGPPERALQRAAEDRQRHGAHPEAGPPLERDGSLLHLPPRPEERPRELVLDPPADGAARGSARPARDPTAERAV